MSDDDSVFDQIEAEELEYEDVEDLSEEPSSSKRRKALKRKLVPHLAKCHICGKGYDSLNGYKNHLKAHMWEDMYLTAPSLSAVESEMRVQSIKILNTTPSAKAQGGFSSSIRDLSKILQNSQEEFFVFVDGLTAVLWSCIPPPTAGGVKDYHSSFTSSVHKLLTDNEERSKMVQCIKEIVKEDIPVKVIEWFTTDIFRKLADCIEAFHLNTMREPRQLLQEAPHRDDPNSNRFQQTVYYIGGSVVRSARKVGLRSSQSEMWKNIIKCIETKLICGENAPAPSSNVSLWTSSIDRGGLFHISDNLWTFLMALTGVCKQKEEKNGSLKHDVVLKALESDDVLGFLWNEVVGGSLSEEESSELLRHICKFFVNAWGAGIALRRKNAFAEICRDKIAFRSTLLAK